jgi:hypothetical protein
MFTMLVNVLFKIEKSNKTQNNYLIVSEMNKLLFTTAK